MSNYSFDQLEALWVQAGGNPLYKAMAAAVALAESGGNPVATNHNSNGSTDRGLWQINSVHGSQSTTNALANARAAVSISNNGTNWKPWCTAWTNDCTGTYLGAGSPVLAHLPTGASTGTTPSGTASSDVSTPALKAIASEYSQIGLPYKFGAEAPGVDFDCSGLTQWAYAQAGIQLPRTAALQQAATDRISKSELRPGDLIFYGAPAHHVAMYIGGGYLIQAPQTGEKVDKVKVWGTPTNYGRVKGSKSQDNNGDLVTQDDASSGGTDVTTAGLTLNPASWVGDAFSQIIKPIGWAIEIAAGAVLLVVGVMFLILSTKTAQEAVGAGAKAAVTGGAMGATTTHYNRPKPAASPSPGPVMATATTGAPRRRAQRTSQPSVGGTNHKVIEGETVA